MTFAEFARAHGLIVDHIPADGAWHRYKTETHRHKRNGSAKLMPDGRFGLVQDHAAHPEPLRWTADADYVAPKLDHAAIARRQAEARRAGAAALKAAMEYWLACSPLRRGHPYLDSHGLDMGGCQGLKVDSKGWLVAPAIRDGTVVTVQRISPDGEKLFWKGLPVSGASYTLTPRDPTVTVVCEGLATGLALYQACRTAHVIVAFDAGNMAKVEIPRRGLVCVAADNDLGTAERLGRNPGIDAATAVSDAIGAGLAVPEGIAGTDWCDWRQEKRAEAMARRARFTSEAQVFKGVDEALARQIVRAAKFLHPRPSPYHPAIASR